MPPKHYAKSRMVFGERYTIILSTLTPTVYYLRSLHFSPNQLPEITHFLQYFDAELVFYLGKVNLSSII